MKLIDPAAGDFVQSLKLTKPGKLQVSGGRMDMPTYNDYGIFASLGGVRTPSWNRLRLSDFPNALEVEPNNSLSEA